MKIEGKVVGGKVFRIYCNNCEKLTSFTYDAQMTDDPDPNLVEFTKRGNYTCTKCHSTTTIKNRL
ncbi:MAG: hypothetical protein KKB31_00675 [Nanoarchaeota archaeon]|nr:hypothetical protein [Nanoarchaeota archaeon]